MNDPQHRLSRMMERAAEAGARNALDELGLSDAQARADLHELRQLLEAWRDAKKSARTALIQWLVRGVLAALLIGIAVRMGFTEYLK